MFGVLQAANKLRAKQLGASAQKAFLGLDKNDKMATTNVPVEFETDPELVADIIESGPKMRTKGDCIQTSECHLLPMLLPLVKFSISTVVDSDAAAKV